MIKNKSSSQFLACAGGAALFFAGCGGGGKADTGDIDIVPSSAIIVNGQSKSFTASLPSRGGNEFQWSIVGSAGKVVKKSSNKARFYAGFNLGGYDLEATLVADPTIKGKVRVQVVDASWLLIFGALFGGSDSHIVSSDLDIVGGSIFLAYNNDNTGNKVLRFDGATNNPAATGDIGSDRAREIAVDSGGNAYVTTDAPSLRKFRQHPTQASVLEEVWAQQAPGFLVYDVEDPAGFGGVADIEDVLDSLRAFQAGEGRVHTESSGGIFWAAMAPG